MAEEETWFKFDRALTDLGLWSIVCEIYEKWHKNKCRLNYINVAIVTINTTMPINGIFGSDERNHLLLILRLQL